MPFMPPPSLFAGTAPPYDGPLYGTGEYWNQPDLPIPTPTPYKESPWTSPANAWPGVTPALRNTTPALRGTTPATFFSGGGGNTQRFGNVTITSNRPAPRPPLPAGTVPYAQLANLVNQFMTQQAAMPLQSNLPGYTGMREQQSKNILSQLQGDVPQDVITQILQQAAERGIMTGAPGGPNANSAYLRALGLTSIGQQQLGQQGLNQAIEQTPVPEIWNPMSLYVPEYLANQELEQATGAGSGGTGGPRGVTRTPWNSYLFPNQNQGNQTPLGTLPGWS